MQRARAGGVTRLGLLGSEDAAQALRLLPPGARMAGDLDQHVGLWDVNGVVTHFGQEHRVHLHRSIMIVIMHANTCLLCTAQVSMDSLYSLRRVMHGFSTEGAASYHCLHRIQCMDGLLQTCHGSVQHCLTMSCKQSC